MKTGLCSEFLSLSGTVFVESMLPGHFAAGGHFRKIHGEAFRRERSSRVRYREGDRFAAIMT